MKSNPKLISKSSASPSHKAGSSVKKPLIIAAVLVVVIMIVSLIAINLTTKKISQGEVSGIEKVVSNKAGQLFVTGGTSDWWKYIADASYDGKALSQLDPFKENKNINKLGYAMYASTDDSIKSGGALRITYLETKDNESATELQGWFEAKKDASRPYNVRTKDNIVAIGPSWAFDNSLYFTDSSLGNDSTYLNQTASANRNANIGYGYLNFSNYFSAMLNSKNDADAKTILNEYIKYEFGIKDKKGVWVGNASTYNSLWKGKFVEGGFDSSLLDPKKAEDIIQNRQKVISDNGQELIVDPRESSLLSDVFVAAPGKSTDTAIKSFKDYFKSYDEAFSKEGFSESSSLLRGTLNISAWNATISGGGQKEENLSTFLFAGKNNEMAFTFLRNPNA
jgi:hypothetical protein